MRQQSLVAGAGEVAFFQTIIVTAVFLVAAPWLLVPPPLDQAPALIFAAMLATASLFLLSWAYRHAEASYLAPSEYTGFLWATLWGWVVFGEQVSLFTVAGAALNTRVRVKLSCFASGLRDECSSPASRSSLFSVVRQPSGAPSMADMSAGSCTS